MPIRQINSLQLQKKGAGLPWPGPIVSLAAANTDMERERLMMRQSDTSIAAA
jgi:hypothetical protein